MAPKELEKVLYFAASIVTWVDDEARAKDLDTLEKEVNKVLDSYAAEREERVLELRESLKRREKYLQNGKQTNFNDEDHLWADSLDVNLSEALRRGAREADQGAAQDLRRRHRRHRGLHRGRRRAHAQRVGAVQDDGAQADRARRDDVPRAQGALRLAVRLRRVLPRRHGRRGGPRPAPAGRPARPNAIELEDQVKTAQGPEAGARGQAAEGRLARSSSPATSPR